MAINVRTDDASGEVMAWGQAAFSDSPPPGQTDAALPLADETDEALLNTYGPRYCIVDTGRIVADTLASAKAAKVKSIRDQTGDLVAKGAIYEGITYMDTDKGRFDVLGIHTLGVIGSSPVWPAMFTDIAGESEISFADADEFGPFFDAMMGAYQHWQSTGQMLVQEVIVAATVGEVDAVTDDRVWPAPLMYWANGTFANASGDRYIVGPDGTLYGPFAAGVPAVAMIGGKNYYQSEAEATNRLADPSTYTLRGTATRVSGQSDPAGGTDAYKFTVDGPVNNNDAFTPTTGGTNDALQATSVFLKPDTATGTLLIKNSSDSNLGQWSVDLSLLAVGVWVRLTSDHPAVTVITAFQTTATGEAGFQFDTAAGPLVFSAWWPQQEEANYPSSPIAPGVTRNADSMSFAAAQIPAEFTSGKWSIDITPMHSNADLATNEDMYIFYFDASNNLRFEESGGVTRVKLQTGGGTIAKAVTYARDQQANLTADFVTGELITAGFTAGNGTTPGTTNDWPASTLYVGTNGANAKHAFMLLSEPAVAA